MSVVTTVEAVPSRIRAVVRLVADIGPASRNEVIACLMPGADKDGMAAKCISETEGLGLIERQGDELSLGRGLRPGNISDDRVEEFLRDWCDRVLILQAPQVDDHNGNVCRAIAWFLCQSPIIPFPWNQHHRASWLESLEGEEDYDLTNSSRFANLFYWARYLGYASSLDAGGLAAIPEPSGAIARNLKTIFNKEKRLPIAEFEKRMAAALPVLEGGTIRSEIDTRLKTRRQSNQFSISTSLALYRLEDTGLIGLESLAEADRRILPVFKEDPKQVTHVSFAGEAKK